VIERRGVKTLAHQEDKVKDKESMDTICIKCGYRYDQHRGIDAACPIKHGVGFYMENQHFCAHPKEEKKVEKQKYKVIKPFTKYDYIVAHQKKYGWTSFKDSCTEFQKDMGRWDNEAAEPDSMECIEGYSDNFYKHGVMFGFLEKVEPEVFYSAGDIFVSEVYGRSWKLIASSNCFDITLVCMETGAYLQPKTINNNQHKIPASEFNKAYPGFVKVVSK
jgi:hypothetical protein